MIEIFSACLGAAGGVQPGRDDGSQRLGDCDNLPLQGEDQDKLRRKWKSTEILLCLCTEVSVDNLLITKFCDFISLDCNHKYK